MRIRKQSLGDRNIVGARIEQRRKAIGLKQKDLLTQLQINGVDLNASGLSKLEGQLRYVTDFELVAIAKFLASASIGFAALRTKNNYIPNLKSQEVMRNFPYYLSFYAVIMG